MVALRAGVLGLALWAAATPAQARQRIELKPSDPGRFGFLIGGSYRLQLDATPVDFAVDAEGTTHGQTFAVGQRLRLGVGVQLFEAFTLDTEWDLFTGQLAGELWQVPVDIDERHREQFAVLTRDGFQPRRIAGLLELPNFTAEVGLISSQWGLGLLANNADRDPGTTDDALEMLFGSQNIGDRVLRARVSFDPRRAALDLSDRLLLSLAVDRVLEDDTARLADRQAAWQGIVSLLYVPSPELGGKGLDRLGAYIVYRDQRETPVEGDLARRFTRAFVIDGFGRLHRSLGAVDLHLGLEAVGVFGQTNRALSYNQRIALNLGSGALTGAAAIGLAADRVRIHVRGGVASGDGDPDDSGSNAFTADRDFEAGMVLFEELMGSVNGASYALLTDPENSGVPPDGADLVVNEGAISGAAWFQPAVQLRPFAGSESGPQLDVRLGMLLAGATAPVRHPFYSFRAGGEARNHHNVASEGTFLGAELNWGVHLGGAIAPRANDHSDRLRAGFSAQGGHLFVGNALRSGAESELDPGVIHRILLTGRIHW